MTHVLPTLKQIFRQTISLRAGTVDSVRNLDEIELCGAKGADGDVVRPDNFREASRWTKEFFAPLRSLKLLK